MKNRHLLTNSESIASAKSLRIKRFLTYIGVVTIAALVVGCPANSLLTNIQDNVNNYKQSQNHAQITAFSFVGYPSNPGVINQSSGTISVVLPYGTSLTALVASFTTSASSVNVGGVAQVPGVTANNFTNPVPYSAVGQNGSTKNYTVTVTVEDNYLITSFNFQGYSSNVGTINSTAGTIAVNLPYLTPVNALVAVFVTNVATKFGRAHV